MKTEFRLIACSILLSALETTAAPVDNVYLRQVEQAKPSENAWIETRKRLEKHEGKPSLRVLHVPPFHKREESERSEDVSFCVDCHGSLPHGKNERLRSFLNMHTRQFECMVCHFRPQELTLSYAWQTEPDNADAERRIIPTYNRQPVSLGRDHPFAIETQQQWKDAGLEKKVRLHLSLHIPLDTQGPACTECHERDAHFLDLHTLGFNEEEIRAIVDNRIARFLGDKNNDERNLNLRDFLQ